MKLVSTALLAALALVPAVAAAQPSAAPPPPPPPPPGGYGYYSAPTTTPDGFQARAGRLALGFGLGLGVLETEGGQVECLNCDYSPLAGGLDFHIGGMVSHRLAILLEVQGNAQTVEDYYDGDKTLSQAALLGAAQFWVTPRIWLKGGLGVAHLQYTYSDTYDQYEESLDTGAAILLGAGVELLQAQTFSIDLQARVLAGSYDLIDDTVTSSQIGIGFNWY